MTFEFDDQVYQFPDCLHEITLGQRIAFQNEYGNELDKQAREITEMKDGDDKELAVTIWNVEAAVKTFSFYTGIPYDDCAKRINIEHLVTLYGQQMAALRQEEAELHVQREYVFNGELWKLEAPELTDESGMTLNEFVHAKEITRLMQQAATGKWEPLLYLCAIYLRKDGEPFEEHLVKPSGDRIKLMKELPLDIALAVGFFLSSTVTIWSSISVYSSPLELRGSVLKHITTNGDGLTS